MSLRERARAFAIAVDDRTGIGKAIAFVNDHQVFGGARFAYAFGSALVFVFILQVVTGIALGTVYAPSTASACGSVHHIQHHMTMGAFVRGVHHFGSSAMIVLCVLHMTQVLLFGAHRKPREANWVLGVVMLLLVLAFGLTGYLLPWDQKGYWATQVATGIIGGSPGGELLQTVLQGGTEYGNATLTRFYALHVLVLPPTLFFLMVGHIALFYRHGVKRSPRAERAPTPSPSVTFWPYQLLRDVIVAAIVFGILAALALLVGVGLDAPADPSSGYEARPEWYFLFLFQLLKFFEGPLTIIGTVVIPGLAFGFLLFLPFIEKRLTPEQRAAGRTGPSKRVLIPYVGMLLAAATLTVWALVSDGGNAAFQEARAAADADAAAAHVLAERGGIDAAGRIVLREGHARYVEHGCAGCHDAEPAEAPRLAGYGSAEHLTAFLDAPNSDRFFGATHLKGQMDPIDVEGAERAALEAYLRAQSGVVASAERLARGREAFVEHCTDCHNAPDASVHDGDAYDPTATGPDLAGLYGFEWTRGLIRDASHPRYYGGALDATQRATSMPPYPDLDDDALSLITRWLLAGAPGAAGGPAQK